MIAGLATLWLWPAQAQDNVDWKAQFDGLDGVSITCMRNIKRKFAKRMCDKLMDHAAGRLSDMDVPHEVVGTAYDRGYRPTPSTKFKNPLNLTIHMRATKPGPLGIDIRISAGVTYKAASEAGGATRQGELIMWQDGLTASVSSGTKKLERAVVPVAQKRMGDIMLQIRENWSR